MLTILLALACTPKAPDPLDAERLALRAVEVERLHLAAREALDTGELAQAAELITAGSTLHTKRFAALSTELDTRLDTAPPKQAAQVHATLYAASTLPQDRRAHRRGAQDAAAKARYLDGERETTQREQEGVTRAMGQRALATLMAEFVDPLPDSQLLEAGAARLALLSDRPIATPKSALAPGFEALCDQAVDLGLEESMVVAELTEAAFESADPWSTPIWPAQVAAWRRHHDGRVEGVIGVQLHGTPPIVRDLAEAGPAWAAGVHQGDTVLAVIEGEQRTDAHAGLEAIAQALRGQNGTEVTLELQRGEQTLSLSMERATSTARTVFPWSRTAAGFDPFVRERIALIRIASFRPHTLTELEAELPPRDALDGLILDLRSNGGGDLAAALSIADRFVAVGSLLTIEGRVLPDFEAGWSDAQEGDPWEGLPLVVLVDANSASSAEVLAAALSQRAGAVLVGERTAGKGTSQVLRTDEELGFAMQFTNLAWAQPDGARLHRADDAVTWGIEPAVRETLSPMERYAVGVLQAKREALKAHADGSAMAYRGPEIDPGVPGLSADPQIQRALQSF